MKFRYKVWDENSDLADEILAIYDTFDIEMNWMCSDDSVTIPTGGNINTQTYIIDVNELTAHTDTISPSVEHRIPSCDMSAEFFYWDDDTKSWLSLIGSTYDGDPFQTLDTATG